MASSSPATHSPPYAPLDSSGGGIKLSQLDEDDAEALGPISLELLGLHMLAGPARAPEEALRTEGIWLDAASLPEDATVWDQFSAGATMGPP